MQDQWTAAARDHWQAGRWRCVPAEVVVEIASGWAVSYVLTGAPDLLYQHELWGGAPVLCVPAGADGAARVAAALADEGEAGEPSSVAIADTGGSTTQMILAALDSAGVRCRILLVGMVFEADAWYGRPSAAAICAVRAWGSRAVQGATRLGFASPWLTAQGPDGRR